MHMAGEETERETEKRHRKREKKREKQRETERERERKIEKERERERERCRGARVAVVLRHVEALGYHRLLREVLGLPGRRARDKVTQGCTGSCCVVLEWAT